MVRLLLLSMVLGATLFGPAEADKDQVSPWLIRNRSQLVDNAKIAKLAILCQKWPAGLVQVAVDFVLRERVGPGASFDRDYANLAIRDGETYALIDFKAAPVGACNHLAPAELTAAANYFADRKSTSLNHRAR